MQKLNALTTLRFFAAASIVIYHMRGFYGVKEESFSQAPYAISFFFILSGFILTYVYSHFKTEETGKKEFLMARIARIWPGHFTYFALTILLTFIGLTSNLGGVGEALLNLLMVHAWIPFSQVFYSHNSPSWSISTEFFFYLCFPFIIYNWNKTWHWKLLLVFTTPFFIMALSAYFKVPDYKSIHNVVTTTGLLYINPLSRMPEFVLGILAGLFWIKYKNLFELEMYKATLIEVAALVIMVLNFKYYHLIVQAVSNFIPQQINHEFNLWTTYGIFASFSFMFLLIALASGKGLISKILSVEIGVILGEISYSIYLSHQLVHRVYIHQLEFFKDVSDTSAFIGSWIVVIAVSFIVWKYIETPARKWMIQKFNSKPLQVLQTS
jgi:peptidoglycan/LPS O-acetylase OafA/YrhL